jgi:hypothetical protein
MSKGRHEALDELPAACVHSGMAQPLLSHGDKTKILCQHLRSGKQQIKK